MTEAHEMHDEQLALYALKVARRENDNNLAEIARRLLDAAVEGHGTIRIRRELLRALGE